MKEYVIVASDGTVIGRLHGEFAALCPIFHALAKAGFSIQG